MSPDLDALLCQRYPKIFVDRHAPMQTTCMVWGFDCGDGWFALIDELCARLQYMTDHEGAPQVVAVQVKEKFGSLEFYVRSATDAQFALIDEIAERSLSICEECGRPGKFLVMGGWYQVRCSEHAP